MNFSSGSGVVVSTWISSVVVTVQRREDSRCGSFLSRHRSGRDLVLGAAMVERIFACKNVQIP